MTWTIYATAAAGEIVGALDSKREAQLEGLDDDARQDVERQMEAATRAARELAELVDEGYGVVASTSGRTKEGNSLPSMTILVRAVRRDDQS